MKEKQLKAEVVNERSHLQRLKEKMTDKNVSVFTYQIEEADFLRLTSPSAVYNQDIHGQTNIGLHHILNNELPYLGF